MKYVVFQKGELLIPVIVPEHCAHSDIHIKGARPVSAGFFYDVSTDSDTVRTYKVTSQISESLKLGPNVKRDTELLADTMGCSGMYAFNADPAAHALYLETMKTAPSPVKEGQSLCVCKEGC